MEAKGPSPEIREEVFFASADRGADRISAALERRVHSVLVEMAGRLAASPSIQMAVERGDAAFVASEVRNATFVRDAVGDLFGKSEAKADDDSLLDEAILVGLLLGARVLDAALDDDQVQRATARAREYISAEVAAQFADVDSQTGKAIALAIVLVAALTSQGGTTGAAALAVFQGDATLALIGLNRLQVQSVVAEATASILSGIGPAAIRGRLMDEAARMLKERAALIANTIAERSINLAQMAAIDTALEDGLIGLDTHLKQWVSRADGNVCPRCVDFHLVVAKMDQPFRSRRGEVAWVPDIHPKGRCRYRVITLAEAGPFTE